MKKKPAIINPAAINPAAEKVLTREEILGLCKAVESRFVQIPGWPGKIKLNNVDFEKFVQLRADAPSDKDFHSMFIAACVEGLNITDAYKLQSGNGIQFSLLLNAVNKFFGLDESTVEAEVKN